MNAAPFPPQNTQWGPVIGIVIIVLLLIVGGAYVILTEDAESSDTGVALTI